MEKFAVRAEKRSMLFVFPPHDLIRRRFAEEFFPAPQLPGYTQIKGSDNSTTGVGCEPIATP
jgi:hypothetical protein